MGFKLLIVALLASKFLLGHAYSAKLATSGCGRRSSKSRIIGGSAVIANSIPWQVGIYRKGEEKIGCGGTLLSDKHVLSAAHCFVEPGLKASDIVVVVAEHDQTNNSDGTRHEISEYTNHPNFVNFGSGPVYDFSMLHLIEPVELGDLAVPACLPDLRFSGDKLVGKNLTISGWGQIDPYSEEKPDLLQSVDVPVISQDECIKAYEDDITDSMICAGYEKGEMDACHGDSGGPLTYEENGKSYLIGVSSWGIGCAVPGNPGVYGRVTEALDWINEQLE